MLSVIVCTRGRSSEYVSSCLSQIKQHMNYANDEIVLVDNNDDPRFEMLAQQLDVRYVHHGVKGIGQARNAGTLASKGDLVAFVDDDCIIDPHWAEKMIERFLEAPELAVVGGSDLTRSNPSFFEKVTGLLSDARGPTKSRLGTAARLDSCNICYRKSALLDCGGFDVELDRSVEVELSFRMYERGYEMLFDPTIVVYHHRRESPREYLRQFFGWGYSNFRVARKYPKLFVRTVGVVPCVASAAFVIATFLGLGYGVWQPFLVLFAIVLVYSGLISAKIAISNVRDIRYIPLAVLALLARHAAESLGFYKAALDLFWKNLFAT